MSQVYVIQNQHRWDPQRQQLVPKFDFSKAEEYGDLVYVLSPKASPFRPASVIPEMRETLCNMRSEDYLLLVGNPCLIGWAVAIAAQYAGHRLRLLQWSGTEQKYIVVESDLNQPE